MATCAVSLLSLLDRSDFAVSLLDRYDIIIVSLLDRSDFTVSLLDRSVSLLDRSQCPC